MQKYSPTVRRGLDKLASYAQKRPFELAKTAELGGDGNDQSFEAAFSNVAHSFLREKAPALLDYEIGFSVLDRAEDNRKAIGVFGFKVGSQWLFAPVFFINGDLKGHELLYLKSQDIFVPLKESWLNYLLNRKPSLLGEPVSRDSQSLGATHPDLNAILRRPYKRASVTEAEKTATFSEMEDAFAEAATTSTTELLHKMAEQVNLPVFLKQAGIEVLERLVGVCHSMPAVAEAIDQFHGLGLVTEAIKTANSRHMADNSVLDEEKTIEPALYTGSVLEPDPLLQHPIKTGELKVITDDFTEQTTLPTELSPEDLESLKLDPVLIKDQRDSQKTTVPYAVQTQKVFFNPAETGLYEVLTNAGEFEKCLVILNPRGTDGAGSFVTVIRVSEPRNWRNVSARAVWAVTKHDADWKKWFEGLSSGKPKVGRRNRYVLLGPDGSATLPFRVIENSGEQLGDAVYQVRFDDYCDYSPDDWKGLRPGMRGNDRDYGYDGHRIHIDSQDGTGLRGSRGDLFVPKCFKLLSIKPESDDDDDCCGLAGSETPPFELGNLLDVELNLLHKTASLELRSDGIRVQINGGPRLDKTAGLISLVVDHGFREDVARGIVKRAVDERLFQCRVIYPAYIKQAYGLAPGTTSVPTPPEQTKSTSPAMGRELTTQTPDESLTGVTSMQADPGARTAYDPMQALTPKERGTLGQAVQTGQKEIFDTSMIGSMLRSVRDDTMVGRYLAPLSKAMDCLGRILFSFYWHSDRFAEKYGKAEMPELEDSLRNNFENLGDQIIFLKQKEIEPYPGEVGVDVDLADSQ